MTSPVVQDGKSPTAPLMRKASGFGRYTRQEHLERTQRGMDWHEQVRQADLERSRQRLHDSQSVSLEFVLTTPHSDETEPCFTKVSAR